MVERRRFLEDVTGKALSDSTIGRLLRRMGFSPKKRSVGALERDEWLRAAWRFTLAAQVGCVIELPRAGGEVTDRPAVAPS